MFGADRNQIRRFFFDTWSKKKQGGALTALEAIVANVILEHPEYHHYLDDADALDKDWIPEQGETNPFLHMGMHISIHEQLGSDQPPGIKQIYQQLVDKYGESHDAEHQMIECLGLVLWQAQTTQKEPDLLQYTECLKKLL